MNRRALTFYSLPLLCRKAMKLSEGYDVISFDIFDTLLIRRNHNPDDLKNATARFIAQRACGLGQKWSWQKVQRLRDKIEAMHRRRAARHHPDHEACYPDFMRDTLNIIFGKPEGANLLEEVTAYELDIEAAFLVARQGFLDLVRDLKKQGKTILAISDMYLPAAHLRILLDRAGYAGLIDQVFASADSMKAKASGAAWPLIREQLALDCSRWLHIGDNPVSDGARPAEVGIQAMVLRDGGELFRRSIARAYHDVARSRPYWRGRLVQQYMLPLEAENVSRTDLYRHGYMYFGPLLCAFVQHIAEQASAKGVERVYFLSREGQLMRDIWRILASTVFAGMKLPEDHYLYVSRMALAGASCAHRGLSHENARIAFLPASNRDFRDLCRVFDLDPSPFTPILRRHGLADDTPLSRWHEGWNPDNGTRFQRMVEHDEAFQAEVRRQSAQANQALQRYLEDEQVFSSSKVALVDIGWLGNIQRFLYQAMEHREDRPELHGHLLVCAAGYPFPYASDNHLEGFYHDHKRFGFTGSLLLYAQELFEETTRANHPGLVRYHVDGDGGYKLVFRPEDDQFAQNEKAQSDYFADVQTGILDGARRYAAAMAVLGYDANDMKPWLDVLTVNHMAFPKTRDVKLLTRIHHLDDFSARRSPGRRARKALQRLWSRPYWQLRFLPGVRIYHYVRHAVHWLRS